MTGFRWPDGGLFRPAEDLYQCIAEFPGAGTPSHVTGAYPFGEGLPDSNLDRFCARRIPEMVKEH